MVAAGLTPLQVLRTSLVNGPKFFGLEEAYGQVAVGKVADLLILEDNPLEDIRNTRRITVVARGSKVYEPNRLQELLQSIRKN